VNCLPVPVLGADTLGMAFYPASPGITYTVETSTHLRAWTTEGVKLSDLDPENCIFRHVFDDPSVSVGRRGFVEGLVRRICGR
jgi:hypothetical protein